MKSSECEKLKAVSEKSQAIRAFLNWLTGERDVTLCDMERATDEYYPLHVNIEQLLAEYFNIDLNKVEKERRAILAELQKAQARK